MSLSPFLRLGADEVWINKLVLDPEVAPALQPNLHKPVLFIALIWGQVLTVRWSNPSSPNGEFVVTLERLPEDNESPCADMESLERGYRPKTWEPIAERRCRTIADLLATVDEFARLARDPGE